MIQKGKLILQELTARLRYRYLPQWVDYLTVVATFRASKKLAAAGVKRVLVDNTVLAHGITHETAWVSTGKTNWGNHEVDTGYAARIPVHDDVCQSAVAKSVRYLPGIVSLVQRGYLALAISNELQDEQLGHRIGRYKGYGSFDHSLFSGVAFEVIEDSQYSLFIDASADSLGLREQRSRRLANKEDSLYRQLLPVLGTTNSQDAWHIVTAERNDCYCFLTMDFSLIRNVRAQAKNKAIKALKTRVLSPEEFGDEFSIMPIPSRLFSYHQASFPVAHQENWPDSKRRGVGKD